VNIDDIPLTAQEFGISQIPTVVLFANGQPISGFVGDATGRYYKGMA